MRKLLVILITLVLFSTNALAQAPTSQVTDLALTWPDLIWPETSNPFNIHMELSAQPNTINDLRLALLTSGGSFIRTIPGTQEANVSLPSGLTRDYSYTHPTADIYQIAVQYSLDGGNSWSNFSGSANPETIDIRTCVGTGMFGENIGSFYTTEALSNGTCAQGPYGDHQCTRLIARYYNHEGPGWVVNGNKYLTSTNAASREMEVYNAGYQVPMVPGNILSFEGPNGFGHVALVTKVEINGSVAEVKILEQNWLENEGEATLPLTISGSGQSRTYQLSRSGGWTALGWSGVKIGQKHDLSTPSAAVIAAYNRHPGMLGTPFDNSGGPYLHYWSRTNDPANNDGVWVQDFMQPDMLKNHYGDDGQTMIVYNESSGTASLIRDGFHGYYKTHEGYLNLGAPLGDESGSVQNFEKGTLTWSGSEVLASHTNGSPISIGNVSWYSTIGKAVTGLEKVNLPDGIYHRDEYICGLDESLPLLDGFEYSDFDAIILGGRVQIDPFTVNGNTTLYIHHTATVGDSRVVDISTSFGSTLLAGEYFNVSAEVLNHTDDGEMYDYVRIRLLDSEYNFIEDFYRPSNATWIPPHTTIYMTANNVVVNEPGIYYIGVQYSEFGPGWYDFNNFFGSNPTMIEVVSPDMAAFSMHGSAINPNSAEVGDLFYVDVSLSSNNDFSYVDELMIEVKDPNGSVISQNSAYGINVGSYTTYDFSLQDIPAMTGTHTAIVKGDVNGSWQEYGMYSFDVEIGVSPPVANFSATPMSGDVPLTVQFTDLSSGSTNEWWWEFGDGNTSTSQHPNHTYTVVGSYTVSLTATNSGGSDTVVGGNPIVVTSPPPPYANFTVLPTSGVAPLTVQCTDTSIGNPSSWAWDIDNDGTVDYTSQNPSHTYTTAGTYTIALTVSNAGGSDDVVGVDIVDVTSSLTAAFTSDVTSGPAPLTVQFTDQSGGNPTSWAWDIDNDGTVDYTSQHPSHTYTAAGTYTIALTVSNAGGSDDVVGVDIITVTDDDSALPCIIGSLSAYQATDIAVSGNYAYVAMRHLGLSVIDISDPTTPVLVITMPTTDYAEGVVVVNNYAYVVGGGLLIVDIFNPATPTEVGSWESVGATDDVVVSGNYAYVVGQGGLTIIDISTPATPAIVRVVSSMGNANGVFVSGNHAYVAEYSGGLSIVDISNPVLATVIGSVVTSGISYRVFVSGNYAYVADHSAGLQVINVSDPTIPVVIYTLDTPGLAQDVRISGNYAYVADHSAGLQVINVSDPTIPVLIGNVVTSGNARGVTVFNGHIYIGNLASLLIAQQHCDISANFIADYTSGDTPLNVQFTDQSVGDPISWAWDIDNDGTVDYTTQNPTHTYVVPGTYSVSFTAERNSDSDTLLRTNYIVVNEALVANFTANPTNVYTLSNVQFTDQSSGSPTSWLWNFGNSITSNVQNPIYAYPIHGTYTISLTVGDGISSDTLVKTDYIVSTKAPEDDDVYPHSTPNPSNPLSVIKFKVNKPGHVNLSIFDVQGRRIQVLIDQNLGIGIHQATFDGAHFSSGIYFYMISSAEGRDVRKITLVK